MKTLAHLLKDHLDYMRSLNYSKVYVRKRNYTITGFIQWLELKYQVKTADQIQRKHLTSWQIYLSEYRTGKNMPFAPSAINQLVVGVNGFLRWLVRENFINDVLAEVLQVVKEPKHLPTSVLTHDQVRKILSVIDTVNTEGYRDRTMLEMLYTNGVRVGELLGMTIDKLDLKNATVLINGKGDKDRVVPIGKTALKYLESYIVAIRPFLVHDRSEKTVFLDRKGKKMKYQNFLARVHKYARKAGLEENVTPHTFRRSCTTELIRSGANMYHVKELLGHESLDTLKSYARLTINDLKKTHAKFHPREREV